MVGTILIAAIYNNTTSLGNAYGVCVIFVTFFDTCMVSLAALLVWRFHPLVVLFPFLVFACLDGTYLSSALTKVPYGAWFTLTLSAVLGGLFILWRFGKESQWAAEAADRFKLSTLINKGSDGYMRLTDAFGGGDLTPLRGFGIFFDKSGEKTPHVFSQFLSKLVAVPECMVFFHLRPLETPSVPVEERFTVTRLGIPGGYRLVVRHGYMDEVITPNLASLIFEQIRDFVIKRGTRVPPTIQEENEEDEKKDNEKEKVNVVEGSRSHSSTSENTESANANPAPAARSPTTDSTEQKAGMLSPTSPTSPRARTRIPESASFPASSTTPSSNKEQQQPPATAAAAATAAAINTDNLDAETVSELGRLEHAFNTQSLYIIGKESLKVKEGTGLFRRFLLEFFVFLRENTRTKIANLRVPIDKVGEVGFVKDI